MIALALSAALVLSVEAAPGTAYTLLESRDLTEWKAVETKPCPDYGTETTTRRLTFYAPTSTEQSSFYRVETVDWIRFPLWSPIADFGISLEFALSPQLGTIEITVEELDDAGQLVREPDVWHMSADELGGEIRDRVPDWELGHRVRDFRTTFTLLPLVAAVNEPPKRVVVKTHVPRIRKRGMLYIQGRDTLGRGTDAQLDGALNSTLQVMSAISPVVGLDLQPLTWGPHVMRSRDDWHALTNTLTRLDINALEYWGRAGHGVLGRRSDPDDSISFDFVDLALRGDYLDYAAISFGDGVRLLPALVGCDEILSPEFVVRRHLYPRFGWTWKSIRTETQISRVLSDYLTPIVMMYDGLARGLPYSESMLSALNAALRDRAPATMEQIHRVGCWGCGSY